MSTHFVESDQEYYVLTNKPELKARAEKLGFENVVLSSVRSLDKSDLDYLEENRKVLVRITYNILKKSSKGYPNLDYHVKDHIIDFLSYELSGHKFRNGKVVRSLADAIELFPKKKTIENNLRSYGLIKEIDYKDRCGNCHSEMGKDDKYCRFCGTERGKGAFEPYRIEHYTVYGPPLKQKFKCKSCGYIWIASQLGSERSEYCPKCGKQAINEIECKYMGRFGSYAVGKEEPYDTSERPVLFSEDQVRSLLNMRTSPNENVTADDEDDDHVSDRDAYKCMRQIGIKMPDRITRENFPRTEKEGEQANLACIILSLKGNNLVACDEVRCSYCGSDCISTLGYTIQGKHYEDIAEGVHEPAGHDPLILKRSGVIRYDNPNERNAERDAYICLCCGTRFGKLHLSKEIDDLYRQQKD